jgi:penicillin-binding protein 2
MQDDALTPFERKAASGVRLIHSALFMALGLLVLLGSLARLQLFQSEEFAKKEAYQTYRRIVKEGARGNIYDRNGVLLAGNRPLFWVGVHLSELRGDFRKRYRELLRDDVAMAEIEAKSQSATWIARREVMQAEFERVGGIIGRPLSLDPKHFEQHFRKRLMLPYPIASSLSLDEYARLVENLPADSPIQLFTDPIRHYPFGSTASHVIGYVGEGSEEEVAMPFATHEGIRTLSLRRRVGRSGLEKSLDAQLKGGLGWEVWSIDPLGFQYDCIEAVEAAKGDDLHTTLDIDLQLVGEAAMQGKVGAIAAILVESGEVLSLVSSPGYDLNAFSPSLSTETLQRINEQEAWLNRATQGLYPPGSTFKVVTALAGLSDPRFNPMTPIYCGPHFMVGDRRFPENRRRGHGFIHLVDALAKSSNVYFYQLGLQVGIEGIARQSRLLGLGQATGVELPFESTRTLIPDRNWKQQSGKGNWLMGDTANVCIGQGDLLVTPLQMARLCAAIAHRREYLPVTLLKDKNTTLYKPKPLPIEDGRFAFVMQGMQACVQNGTGTSMQSSIATIAAKTGTAQVFPGGVEENLAWVIAFAPVDKPRIAVAVVIEDIGSSDPIYGGSTAGPVARQVIEEFLGKYRDEAPPSH